jgi:multidrug transporter EmrE-like cation transporter
MNAPTSKLVSHPLLDRISQRTRSLLLVSLCTIFGAAAQILMKTGTKGLPPAGNLVDTVIGIFTNPYLFAGYSLYGISAVLLILALRHGELSILYPVIALTYVWVAILSVVVFQEQMPPLRIAGIATVVLGVAILGRSR